MSSACTETLTLKEANELFYFFKALGVVDSVIRYNLLYFTQYLIAFSVYYLNKILSLKAAVHSNVPIPNSRQ